MISNSWFPMERRTATSRSRFDMRWTAISAAILRSRISILKRRRNRVPGSIWRRAAISSSRFCLETDGDPEFPVPCGRRSQHLRIVAVDVVFRSSWSWKICGHGASAFRSVDVMFRSGRQAVFGHGRIFVFGHMEHDSVLVMEHLCVGLQTMSSVWLAAAAFSIFHAIVFCVPVSGCCVSIVRVYGHA